MPFDKMIPASAGIDRSRVGWVGVDRAGVRDGVGVARVSWVGVGRAGASPARTFYLAFISKEVFLQ